VKTAGEKYLPRLESQTDDEYNAYRARAAFFNASARTADGFVGLVCRRPPFIKVPDPSSSIGKALGSSSMMPTCLGHRWAVTGRRLLSEVIAVGRAGTLVDWEAEGENRVYVSRYAAEDILNWRTERINGRNLLTLVALHELRSGDTSPQPSPQRGEGDGTDAFVEKVVEQIRVLRLVEGRKAKGVGRHNPRSHERGYHYVVEIWQRFESKRTRWNGNLLKPGYRCGVENRCR